LRRGTDGDVASPEEVTVVVHGDDGNFSIDVRDLFEDVVEFFVAARRKEGRLAVAEGLRIRDEGGRTSDDLAREGDFERSGRGKESKDGDEEERYDEQRSV